MTRFTWLRYVLHGLYLHPLLRFPLQREVGLTCVECEVAFANSIYHTSTVADMLAVFSSTSDH